tara:strand:+ start:210 stop:758 length:549 start_codon:yes stop_codon:yes gene_type:complete
MKQIKKKKIFSNEVFDVYKNNFILKNKQLVKDYLSVEPNKKFNKSGGVMVLPIQNQKIGLMKVYYPIINNYLFSLPQGFCDKGEIFKNAAKRELEEETGFIVKKKNLQLLTKFYPNPSMINSKITIFITSDLTKKVRKKSCNVEIGVGKMSFFSENQIMSLIRKKNFDLISLSAILFYYLKK